MQAAPVSVEQLVGQTFGDFSIDRLLGRGALSAVYLAHRSHPERRVLLTVFLLPAWCGEPQRALFMERFSKIASTLVALEHPHITSTYSFGEQFGYPYLVTDFLEEISLASLLKQQTRCTPMQTLALLKQIAEALDYAHEHGMVHGALRPANILLDSQQKVHITGMGLARMLEMRGIGSSQHPLPHLYSLADTLLYSPAYLAPEVIEGQPADARSDMYALGCILYELLCGQPPFSGDDPVAVAMLHVQQPIPSLQSVYALAPAALDLIVQRTLERDPDRRYQSARKLASVFGRVLNVLDAAASPSSTWRNPTWLLDISERPTLPWFEADSPGVVQWSPMLSSKVDAISIGAGVKSVMPPAVPWNAVRSAIEDASRSADPSVIQLSSQDTAEIASTQPALSSEARQAELVAQGALAANIWPTSVPEFGQGVAAGTLQPEKNAERSTQKSASSPVRRRGVLLAITGGVIATGLLTFGGLGLAHMLPFKQLPIRTGTPANVKNTDSTNSTKSTNSANSAKNTGKKTEPAGATAPRSTPTPTAAPTSPAVTAVTPPPATATLPQPTVTPMPTPTVAATPTPAPKKKSKNRND